MYIREAFSPKLNSALLCQADQLIHRTEEQQLPNMMDRSYRIAVLGAKKTGKTCLINRLLQKRFPENSTQPFKLCFGTIYGHVKTNLPNWRYWTQRVILSFQTC